MGRLVIDGNSVYEIDEECVRRNRPPENCGIYEYLDDFSGEGEERKNRIKKQERKSRFVFAANGRKY